MKTFFPKKEDVKKKWYIVDAEDKVLGRLCSRIALILMGKHLSTYTPFIDTGGNVIVINAGKVRLTGNKFKNKTYYRHSGYPGGIKSSTAREILETRPERIIQLAVKGMLPKNKLGRKILKNLKIYSSSTHPHSAQQPAAVDNIRA